MKIRRTVQVTLSESEYFVSSDRYSDGPIQVQTLQAEAERTWVYGHGPKMLKNGKVSAHRRSCILVELSTLPEFIREAFELPGAPAVSVGAEAARQAALG